LGGESLAGQCGAESHTSAHPAPDKQGKATNNCTGQLRQYVGNGKASFDLAKQPEDHRNSRIDMCSADFSYRG